VTSSLRIALVSPRFDPITAVGAEERIRRLAAGLAARGHGVELLTTCVRDPMTWKNHYQPGRIEESPFAVSRFPVDPRRVSRRFLEAAARIGRGTAVGREEEEAWAAGLGFSSALAHYLADSGSRFDAFVFAPLVCGTTFGGLASVASRSLLLPALPDGPAARLGIVRENLAAAGAILAGSGAERDLIASTADIPVESIPVGASGVAPAAQYDPEGFRRRHGIEVPFLIYTGRRSREKGVHRLMEYAFSAFRNGGIDFRLVLTGEEALPLPDGAGDCILDLHFLGEQDRADGLAAALAFCQPSAAEGLALSPLESWLAGRPVVTDAVGAVTRARCADSGGGLWYDGALEFEETVRLLLEDGERAAAMGSRGRDFVLSRWPWERTLEAVEEACASLAGGGR
jgi:glycosyltransferase involved in cell wall biosynthesis